MNAPKIKSYGLYGELIDSFEPGSIHVENVNDRRFLHGGSVEAHQHPHLHQLALWHHGEGSIHIDSDSHFLKGSMLSWIPRSIVHGFVIDGNCDATVVSISDEFLRGRLLRTAPQAAEMDWREPALLAVDEAQRQALEPLFTGLVAEYARPALHRSEALAAWAELVFLAFLRLGRQQRLAQQHEAESSNLYRRFLVLLDKQQGVIPSVSGMAAQLATTPYLLNKAVRNATGYGPAEIIRHRLVNEAKRLLLFTALKVEEVGFTLGFDDPAHFGRLFRHHTGLAPGKWRHRERRTMEQNLQKGG